MKLRFVIAIILFSLSLFVPYAHGGGVCVYDSDCDCSGVTGCDEGTPEAQCCGDPSWPDSNYCLCTCGGGSCDDL